jgi:hypothetical protein
MEWGRRGLAAHRRRVTQSIRAGRGVSASAARQAGRGVSGDAVGAAGTLVLPAVVEAIGP